MMFGKLERHDQEIKELFEKFKALRARTSALEDMSYPDPCETVTQGDLKDLRADIRHLSKEVARLTHRTEALEKSPPVAFSPTAKPEIKKRPTESGYWWAKPYEYSSWAVASVNYHAGVARFPGFCEMDIEDVHEWWNKVGEPSDE